MSNEQVFDAAPEKKRRGRKLKVQHEEMFLSPEEDAIVQAVMGLGMEDAAMRLGMRTTEIETVLNRSHVQRFMLDFRREFSRRLARRRVSMLVRKGVTRENVLERLMELANLDPEETKGSIIGQVKALEALGDFLGMSEKDPLKNKSTDELKAIVLEAQRQSALTDGDSPKVM